MKQNNAQTLEDEVCNKSKECEKRNICNFAKKHTRESMCDQPCIEIHEAKCISIEELEADDDSTNGCVQL